MLYRYLTNPTSRPFLRKPAQATIKEVRAIVSHWTANTGRGAGAIANRNYFNMGLRFASAHYVIDDQAVVKCMPEIELAYHVGAKNYKPIGYQLMKGYPTSQVTPNHFTIGYELCVNKDGDFSVTRQESLYLAAYLLIVHNLNPQRAGLLRHFDITGKDCPKMFLDTTEWEAYKKEIGAMMVTIGARTKDIIKVNTPGETLNIRSGPGTNFDIIGYLSDGEKVLSLDHPESITPWVMIRPGEWVHGKFTIPA